MDLRNSFEAVSKKLLVVLIMTARAIMNMSGVNKMYDKVGPLEDSAGNIISQGFSMAEDLNGYFSSVLILVLGQLIVTPEMVAKKIKAVKDNRSPGVDGIPSKILMETVQQISIPLASVQLVIKRGG